MNMKDLIKFELSVLIEKNKSTNERKLNAEIEKLLSNEFPIARNQSRPVQEIQVMLGNV